MRVGMNTSAFGAVEVRTMMRDSQVGVAVGSERGDLRSYLAPELADLQNSLQQHEIHLEPVRYLNGNLNASYSGGSGGNPGSGQNWQPRSFIWPRFPAVRERMQEAPDAATEIRDGISLHA